MPLSINREVFITCAVTGSADTASKSRNVPRSPKEIAAAAVEAAKAGAAVVHIHVRDPETGAPSNQHELYKEVTDRIRQADTDVVLNITAGMGGDVAIGSVEQTFPWTLGPISWERRKGLPILLSVLQKFVRIPAH